jgi:hypothetical protein
MRGFDKRFYAVHGVDVLPATGLDWTDLSRERTFHFGCMLGSRLRRSWILIWSAPLLPTARLGVVGPISPDQSAVFGSLRLGCDVAWIRRC